MSYKNERLPQVKNVEKYSQIGKKMARLCDGLQTDDVFWAAYLFFSNMYAMQFGEPCRRRMLAALHERLGKDINEKTLD